MKKSSKSQQLSAGEAALLAAFERRLDARLGGHSGGQAKPPQSTAAAFAARYERALGSGPAVARPPARVQARRLADTAAHGEQRRRTTAGQSQPQTTAGAFASHYERALEPQTA